MGSAGQVAGDKIWFLFMNGRQEGPFTLQEAKERVSAEKAADQCFAFRQGMENWGRISEMKEFHAPAATKPVAASVAPPAPPAAPASVAPASPVKAVTPAQSANDDLSALLEIKPEEMKESTEVLDLAVLKAAEQEAAAIGKSGAVRASGTEAALSRSLIRIALVLIALGVAAVVLSRTGGLQNGSKDGAVDSAAQTEGK